MCEGTKLSGGLEDHSEDDKGMSVGKRGMKKLYKKNSRRTDCFRQVPFLH